MLDERAWYIVDVSVANGIHLAAIGPLSVTFAIPDASSQAAVEM